MRGDQSKGAAGRPKSDQILLIVDEKIGPFHDSQHICRSVRHASASSAPSWAGASM